MTGLKAQPMAPPTAAATGVPGPVPWPVAVAALGRADTYWLATTRPDGRPHAVPVLGVVVDGAWHFCAGDRTRKARNIAADPRCAVNTATDTLDLALEGTAVPVTVEAVRRVAEAYGDKYGWRPQVRDGVLWADGAPTAGPPPYRVYRVEPDTAFAFPTGDGSVATRYEASRAARPSR
jgi:hypothetical protein